MASIARSEAVRVASVEPHFVQRRTSRFATRCLLSA
jgi:hypothetical protein